jgi:hypothetical protein
MNPLQRRNHDSGRLRTIRRQRHHSVGDDIRARPTRQRRRHGRTTRKDLVGRAAVGVFDKIVTRLQLEPRVESATSIAVLDVVDRIDPPNDAFRVPRPGATLSAKNRVPRGVPRSI